MNPLAATSPRHRWRLMTQTLVLGQDVERAVDETGDRMGGVGGADGSPGIPPVDPVLVIRDLRAAVVLRRCDYFSTDRKQALRFVKSLVQRRAAVENENFMFSGRAKPCRISSNAIYRALGVENIRHRRKATKPVLMRRLLSLDFVLEHPGMNWLPAEPEKVEFFENLGLPLRLLPRRIYYGAAGNQKRYFALKLPLAVDPEIVTFALRRSGPPDR